MLHRYVDVEKGWRPSSLRERPATQYCATSHLRFDQGAGEIVKRSDEVRGFQVLPRRWVVERTFPAAIRSASRSVAATRIAIG